MKRVVTIESKKAFVQKSREANYQASLKLEGFKIDSSVKLPATKTALVEKYRSMSTK